MLLGELLLDCILLHVLVRPHPFLDLGRVVILRDLLDILELQLRVVVAHPELVDFSVFLLAYQNAFVKELAVLSGVECVILHRNILAVDVGRQFFILIYDFRGFKFIAILIIVLHHRIVSFLVV